MRFKSTWKILYAIVIILGIIFPFIDYLTVIEMFYLLIPFRIVVIVTIIFWIVSLFYKTMDSKKSFLVFLVIPVFILSQILSAFTVDKIQRLRSEKIIKVIEEKIKDNEEIPKNYDTKLGIKYVKSLKDNKFIISYSRGFMVTEKYDSELKTWKSFGWND